MKQTKKKIKTGNIKRRTKNYNYRKIQRGGWRTLKRSDPQLIRREMTSLDGFAGVRVEFPFENINMDITLQPVNLNTFMIEKENEYLEPVKRGLTNDIDASKVKKAKNQKILSENPSGSPPNTGAIIDEMEANINRDSILLYHLNSQNQPLNFSIVPDVIDFITYPYDISQFFKGYNDLALSNNFVGLHLEPKQQTAGAGVLQPTVPKEVVFLIKIMRQLAREINGSAIYINGAKQSFAIDPSETAASSFLDTEFQFKTTSNRYGNILTKIKNTYSGSERFNFSKINFEILAYLIEDNPGQGYFMSFIQNILDNSKSGMFTLREARSDFVVENGQRIRQRDSIALVEPYIKLYRDKYEYDTTYFGLKPIQENQDDGNFLQYVKNGCTFFITVGTDIIIELVRIYYIYVREVNAVGKREYNTTAAFQDPTKPYTRAENYDNIIIAAIVAKKTINIITGTINYENNFRWLLNQHTINNMKLSNIGLPDIFLNNIEEVKLADYSTPTKAVKSTWNSLKGLFGVPAALPVGEEVEREEASFSGPEPGLKLMPNIKSSSANTDINSAVGEEEWQQVDYKKETDDLDTIGGKKNKTRRKTIKRKGSIKRKSNKSKY